LPRGREVHNVGRVTGKEEKKTARKRKGVRKDAIAKKGGE